MHRQILNYFNDAAILALSKDDKRVYLFGAIGIRRDGTKVQSINSPTESPHREAHAEYKLCRKLDSGSTIYIARIRVGDGTFAMSRPCVNCQKVLRTKRIKRVYYSISDTEWGLWVPETNKDIYYNKVIK